ncbi:BMP-binding endothelial regulator protein-like isoform X1 [Varroa destructor]|uniref:BMP-binding endothelial regulator protein n=1 Tax=Varroa destructor TaxID=109461 RepID=A0A7M7L3N9_VARDE|nr:BMP-binding endothelial regulator protein-like isoform X1 [Varroa destructor]
MRSPSSVLSVVILPLVAGSVYASFFSDVIDLKGSYIKCSPEQEGRDVPISMISKDNPCIHCKCQKRVVECRRETCELPKGCYFLDKTTGASSDISDSTSKKKTCCHQCKGCVLNGTAYNSPSTWTEPGDPCLRYTCQSGIVTKSREVCHVPCQNPLSPKTGHCCPSCKGCLLNGINYAGGEIFEAPNDPCLKCICQEGSITCQREACPVMACPFSRQMVTAKACCPTCRGTKSLVGSPLGGRCMIGTEVFDDGTAWPLDQCTSCSCTNGTSVCHRIVCPRLECPPEHQTHSGDTCCPRCRSPALQEKREKNPLQQCTHNGRLYMDGDTWKAGRCKECRCQSGAAWCAPKQCPPSPKCPPKHRLVLANPGDCCPSCVESDGVCAVFGDPHYRTFDGVMYSFQGQCRYMLVTDDCLRLNESSLVVHGSSGLTSSAVSGRSTFSVQVFNDPRRSKHYSWTRGLLIRVDKHKIRLGQMIKVKILEKRVKLPYVALGDVTIFAEGTNIVVRLRKKGIKLLWNGDNYVEVSASPSLKGSLCGLCGNFNDKQDDEYTTKRGVVAQNVNDFGSSWKVGHRKNCLQPVPHSACKDEDRIKRRRNVTICGKLKGGPFKPCHKHVNAVPYIRACQLDMCSCGAENGRCYCSAMEAYARECARANITLAPLAGPSVKSVSGTWQEQTGCQHHWCPAHSTWTPCGGVCRKTCRNHVRQSAPQCNKKCVAGCQCNPGRIWQDNRCVKPNECLRRLGAVCRQPQELQQPSNLNVIKDATQVRICQ